MLNGTLCLFMNIVRIYVNLNNWLCCGVKAVVQLQPCNTPKNVLKYHFSVF